MNHLRYVKAKKSIQYEIPCTYNDALPPTAAHWFFLEIFVRKFKGGNQRVLVQNWVKNVGINKCSLSKN